MWGGQAINGIISSGTGEFMGKAVEMRRKGQASSSRKKVSCLKNDCWPLGHPLKNLSFELCQEVENF